ncbi:MAG: methyl-accepting chemotaxis protein [Desulfitobacteriia bacterium]|jgi:uncharacterized protein YoxC
MKTILEVKESFDAIIPLVVECFNEDCIIFVLTDGDEFLSVCRKNFPTKTMPGDPVPEDDTNYKVFRSGEPIFEVLPKEIFGFAFSSNVVPVKDESGNTIGTFAFGKSLQRQHEILEASEGLATALGQISATLNQLSSGIQEVVSSSTEILRFVGEVQEENKKADEITQFVKNIAGQTNLLGLNAAIEAARAGDQGRGFGVVADEIRKLSTSSNESIKGIEEFLKKTNENLANINQRLENANAVFQEQAAGIEEITASVQELNATAQYLKEISGRL